MSRTTPELVHMARAEAEYCLLRDWEHASDQWTQVADHLEDLSIKLTEAVEFWELHRARVVELEAEVKYLKEAYERQASLVPNIIAVAQSHGDRPYEEADRLLDHFGVEA